MNTLKTKSNRISLHKLILSVPMLHFLRSCLYYTGPRLLYWKIYKSLIFSKKIWAMEYTLDFKEFLAFITRQLVLLDTSSNSFGNLILTTYVCFMKLFKITLSSQLRIWGKSENQFENFYQIKVYQWVVSFKKWFILVKVVCKNFKIVGRKNSLISVYPRIFSYFASIKSSILSMLVLLK